MRRKSESRSERRAARPVLSSAPEIFLLMNHGGGRACRTDYSTRPIYSRRDATSAVGLTSTVRPRHRRAWSTQSDFFRFERRSRMPSLRRCLGRKRPNGLETKRRGRDWSCNPSRKSCNPDSNLQDLTRSRLRSRIRPDSWRFRTLL